MNNKEEVLEAYLKEADPDSYFPEDKEFYIVHDLENTKEINSYIREFVKEYLESCLNDVSLSCDIPTLTEYVDFDRLLEDELSKYEEISDIVEGDYFTHNGKEYFIETC